MSLQRKAILSTLLVYACCVIVQLWRLDQRMTALADQATQSQGAIRDELMTIRAMMTPKTSVQTPHRSWWSRRP